MGAVIGFFLGGIVVYFWRKKGTYSAQSGTASIELGRDERYNITLGLAVGMQDEEKVQAIIDQLAAGLIPQRDRITEVLVDKGIERWQYHVMKFADEWSVGYLAGSIITNIDGQGIAKQLSPDPYILLTFTGLYGETRGKAAFRLLDNIESSEAIKLGFQEGRADFETQRAGGPQSYRWSNHVLATLSTQDSI